MVIKKAYNIQSVHVTKTRSQSAKTEVMSSMKIWSIRKAPRQSGICSGLKSVDGCNVLHIYHERVCIVEYGMKSQEHLNWVLC